MATLLASRYPGGINGMAASPFRRGDQLVVDQKSELNATFKISVPEVVLTILAPVLCTGPDVAFEILAAGVCAKLEEAGGIIGAAKAGIMAVAGADDLILDGILTVGCNSSDTNGQAPIFIYGGSAGIKNVTILNCEGRGGNGNHFRLQNVQGFTLENCRSFETNGQSAEGASFQGCSDGLIEGCEFVYSKTAAARFWGANSNITVRRNIFRNASQNTIPTGSEPAIGVNPQGQAIGLECCLNQAIDDQAKPTMQRLMLISGSGKLAGNCYGNQQRGCLNPDQVAMANGCTVDVTGWKVS